jgi:hypothetical protein
MKLKFNRSLFFTKTIFNIGLQLADIIVGCTKCFIDYVNEKEKRNSLGVEQFKKIKEKFYCSKEGDIVNYGITVSGEKDFEDNFKNKIKASLKELCKF